MASNTRNRAQRGHWLVVLAIGSVASAIALAMLLVSTGRGTVAIGRLGGIWHPRVGPDVRIRERVVNREVEVPVAANGGEAADGKSYDTRKLYNGLKLEAKLDKQPGQAASVERAKDDSYAIQVTLSLRAPQPVATAEGLESVQSGVTTLLPGLKEMLPGARVSPYFAKLYANKEDRLQRNLLQLDKLLSRHNYFDCETILELKHPATGRRALLVQAEMDVVSDGSDGDRLPEMPDTIVQSSFYQPTTSYGWPKTSAVPNPLAAGIEARLKKAREEFAMPGLPAERNAQLKEAIASGARLLADLKTRSFLIADYDPFMVLPVFMVTDRAAGEAAARVGDYAVVIHGGRVFPAIVGDAGPDFKIGEASLRIAREIDPSTNAFRRPVNDLKVTYLVFPGSAEPAKSAPDLARWGSRCDALLKEIGGLGQGVATHQWDDVLQRMAEEREAKRKAEEEAKRKAEEEAKRKAEEEAKRKAEEEAKATPVPAAP